MLSQRMVANDRKLIIKMNGPAALVNACLCRSPSKDWPPSPLYGTEEKTLFDPVKQLPKSNASAAASSFSDGQCRRR